MSNFCSDADDRESTQFGGDGLAEVCSHAAGSHCFGHNPLINSPTVGTYVDWSERASEGEARTHGHGGMNKERQDKIKGREEGGFSAGDCLCRTRLDAQMPASARSSHEV